MNRRATQLLMILLSVALGGPLFGWLTGYGLPLGLVWGLLFGLCFASFEGFMRRRLNKQVPADLKDAIVLRSLANHFRSGESVGGQLFLTESQLVFEPHAINLQKGRWMVPRSEVISVRLRRTAGVIPNGIEVETATTCERFVVESRQRWVSALSQ